MPKKKPSTAVPKHLQIIGQESNKKLLRLAAEKDMPVLLIGHTGTGKSSLVREQAIEHGASWVRFNLTGETTVDDFVGKYELEGGKTVWRDGVLLQAMKEGKWLIVDEINVALPEILFVLHSLLDDDKFIMLAAHAGEVVRPHKDFRLFATMNPSDEYAGTKELNKAFQSRFSIVLEVDYPANKQEAKIIAEKTGVKLPEAHVMADVASALRKAKADDKIFFTCSTRDLLHWGGLVEALGMEEAFSVSVLNKTGHDKPKVAEIYKNITKRHLELKTKTGIDELSIDYFEGQLLLLEAKHKEFESSKAKLRAQIAEEIVRSITAVSTFPAGSTADPAIGAQISLEGADIKF